MSYNRQACIISEKQPLKIQKSPLPELSSPQSCIIQVLGCGLCHTDLHLQENGYDLGVDEKGNRQILRFTDRGFSYPLTPGHEIVGRVYRIGSRVSSEKLNVNDLVLVYPWIGCGSCDRCLSRQYHLCDGDESQDIGFDLAGGFSDYVLVPDVKYLVPLNLQDFTDPLPLCVLSCSGVTSMAAVKAAQTVQPKYLVIVGCGGLGMMTLQLATILLPQTTILCVDIDDIKLEAAKHIGAHHVFNSQHLNVADKIKNVCFHGKGPDCAIDFVGSNATFQLCFETVRKHGKIISVGLMGGNYNLLLPLLPLKAIQIEGILTGSFDDLLDLVKFVQTKRLKLDRVVTKFFKLEDINQAFDELRHGKIIGRCVILP